MIPFPISEKNAVIDFIEAYHTAFMEFPRRAQIVETLTRISGCQYDPSDIDHLLEDEAFNKSLDERGIVPPWALPNSPVGLTKEQLAAVAVLNDIKDRRSDSKKLADLGISSRKYAGWVHDRRFADYMKKSANNLLYANEAEAHKGLLRSLNSNNTAAQKLYFEMTGRYNPAHESAVNVQELMTLVVEVIQKHVQDEKTLLGIAADLQMAAIKAGVVSKNNEPLPMLDASVEKKQVGPVDTKFDPPVGRLTF